MKTNLRSLVAAGLFVVSSASQSYAANTNDNYAIGDRTNNYSLENAAIEAREIETGHKEGVGFPWPLGVAVAYMFILAAWPTRKKKTSEYTGGDK
ncbi:MAG: hypothetical protein Q8Q31_04785 [Nanoarchaeota archaeon]|nr:hypothetical protein [Nanoarchaeota archaeon]